MKRTTIPPVLFAALFSTTAFAADEIGSARQVSESVHGTPPGEQRMIVQRKDPVFAGELVETDPTGWAFLRFDDRSRLNISSNTSLVLDEFVYRSKTADDALGVNISKGVLRFISGKIKDEGYRIETPTALIGVRGTDFIVAVADDGATTVTVLEGAVSVTSVATGQAVSVGAQSAVGVGAGGEISDTAYAVPSDAGLDTLLGGVNLDGGGGGGGGGD